MSEIVANPITDADLKAIPRFEPLPLDRMSRAQKIDALYETLTSLWSGGGDYGVYTVAIQRERLRPLLHDLLSSPTHPTT